MLISLFVWLSKEIEGGEGETEREKVIRERELQPSGRKEGEEMKEK